MTTNPLVPVRNGSSAASAAVCDVTMLGLLRGEAESCAATLDAGLVALETSAASDVELEALMRAAHSVKGAFRIVNLAGLCDMAHAMEDCFVAAQNGERKLESGMIDVLLRAVDLLKELAQTPDAALGAWVAEAEWRARLIAAEVTRVCATTQTDATPATSAAAAPTKSPALSNPDEPAVQLTPNTAPEAERAVRVAADSMSRIMGLAGESLVEARRAQGLRAGLNQLERRVMALVAYLDETLTATHESRGAELEERLAEAKSRTMAVRAMLGERLEEFDGFTRRFDGLSERLYREARRSRMRPFADGVQALPRLARDLGRELGKSVSLEVLGGSTLVDRDVLERLEAPLNHLVRNAVDHGIETADERARMGKPERARLRVEAHHHAGRLQIRVSDDGRGIDPEKLRLCALERGLVSADMAASLSDQELLEFLFLPGFSTAREVTQISGRGVGLDAVRSMVVALCGNVSVASKAGQGVTFHLELPVTRSVVRAILVDISGERYGLALASIQKVVRIRADQVETVEGAQSFMLDGRCIGLVAAAQLLQLDQEVAVSAELCVVVVGHGNQCFGLVVDAFRGEEDLIVRPLDARLGKVQSVSAAAVLADGTAALILDIDDLVAALGKILQGSRLDRIRPNREVTVRRRKRILVVDDSITVREVERQLLVNHGYEVAVSVDGADGYNALKSSSFDLLITDVDMPRMSGIDLVRTVKRDARLKAMPTMIVSYKDREEDRMKGLDAGADYYLTKSSFHDDALIRAVEDLIGSAAE